jgi:hypothetical protein
LSITLNPASGFSPSFFAFNFAQKYGWKIKKKSSPQSMIQKINILENKIGIQFYGKILDKLEAGCKKDVILDCPEVSSRKTHEFSRSTSE